MKKIHYALMLVCFFSTRSLFGVVAVPVITPIDSTVNLHAESDAGIGLVSDDDVVSQGGTLNPLSASVFAKAFAGSLSDSTASEGSATWTSSSAGQFVLHTKFTSDNLGAYPDSRVATGSPGWFYTFSSDSAAILNLNFNITHSGSFAFGNHLDINQMIGGGVVRQVEFGIPSSGTASFTINPNVIYTFEIFDNSNLNQSLPAFTSDMNATFSFQIVPVPEPSTLALLGVGAAALIWRRRGTLHASRAQSQN